MKILIVDDHIMVGNGFKSLFAMHGHETVIGEIEYTPLMETIEKEQPDILLVDIELGKLDHKDNGIRLTQKLLEAEPELKIILISGFDIPVFHEEARKCGAKGFILKTGSETELLTGMEKVLNNESIFPEKRFEMEENIVERLEPIHKEILQLLASQKSLKEIPEILRYSERSIRAKTEEIRKILNVSSTNQAIAKAIALGVAKPEL